MLIGLDIALSDVLKILCRFRQPHSQAKLNIMYTQEDFNLKDNTFVIEFPKEYTKLLRTDYEVRMQLFVEYINGDTAKSDIMYLPVKEELV